jgi:toxin CcdB
MAQFDVYRQMGGMGHLLDCQADVLSQLNTRLVVPLLPRDEGPPMIPRLNPLFLIGDEERIMYTQFATAMPTRDLRIRVASLAQEHNVIMNAFDMLLTGY